MSQIDELVDRLTGRLSADAELRMEVAHELRAHLEDSAAEFRRAGASDADAITSAAKAMGDEAEVAQQLWQANRRRLQVRKTVKWAAGVTLMPAAIAVSATVAWSAIVSVAMLFAGIAFIGWHDFGLSIFKDIATHVRQAQIGAIPASQRALFHTQGYASDEATGPATGPEKSLIEEHPNDPVYYANFASATVLRRPVEGWRMSAGDLAHITDVLDHGKIVEPNNAYYPLLKAGVLLSASAKLIPDKPYQATFEYIDGKGDKHSFNMLRYEVLDRSMMNRALAELHEAAAKQYLDSHAGELLDRRLALLPPATNVSDQMLRIETQYSVGLPYLNVYFQASEIAAFAAAQEALENHPDLAMAIVGDFRQLARLGAARSRFSVDLQLARGMYYHALGVEAWIDLQTNNQAQFIANTEKLRQYEREIYNFRDQFMRTGAVGQEQFLHGGLVTRPAAPAFVDQASRRADYSIFDRAALSLLLIVLTMLTVGAAVRGLARQVRTGKWPAIAFMGWRRLGAVVLISSLVPVGLFVVYAYLTPLGQREYGMQTLYDRVVAEHAVVIMMVIVLVRVLSTIALRRRGVEIGSAQLQALRFDRIAIVTGLALATAAVVYLIVWQVRIQTQPARAAAAKMSLWSSPTEMWGTTLAIATLFFGIYRGGTAAPPGSVPFKPRWRITSPAFLVVEVVALAVLGAGLIVVVDAGHRFFSEALVDWLTHNLPWLAAIIAACVAFILGYGLLRRYFGIVSSAEKPGGFSLSLSMAPAMVLTALVLALVADPLLQQQERRAVSSMTASHTGYDFTHELDNSPMRLLQQQLADAPP